MDILYITSEAVPFAKTGGLADVSGSLPKAFEEIGTHCRVVLPLYESIPAKLRETMHFLCHFQVPVAWRTQYCGVFEAKVGNVIYYFIDNEYYFKRPNCYGYYDEAERFVFFARAVLEMLPKIDFKPDILHANDWQTGLVPVFLNAFYRRVPFYERMETVFTVHNVEYQGKYGYEIYSDVLGLPEQLFHLLDFNQCLNFMKGAIISSDAVTTVSPTYSHELRYPYFSFGLDPVFNSIGYKLHGILNGINTEDYNPATDPALFKSYSVKAPQNKQANKVALQKMLGLPVDKNAFLLAYIGRLVPAKGIALIQRILEELLNDSVQFVLLGTGETTYEQYFHTMQEQHPNKMVACLTFSEELARKIYAGADALLMPSRTEPCGLSQLIALRYGTVPIVHQIGGLADTVSDCGDVKGNGFTFKQFNAHDMLRAIRRAEGLFFDQPKAWAKFV